MARVLLLLLPVLLAMAAVLAVIRARGGRAPAPPVPAGGEAVLGNSLRWIGLVVLLVLVVSVGVNAVGDAGTELAR